MRIIQYDAAGQVSGAHRIIQAFAGNRIDQARGIAAGQPPIARNAIPLPAGSLERRKNVTVKRGVLRGDALLLHITFESCAQRLGGLALSTDSNGEMAASRENPDV